MGSTAELYLTSSPFLEQGGGLDPANGFEENLRKSVSGVGSALFITANPDRVDYTRVFFDAIFETMRLSGIEFEERYILDRGTAGHAGQLISESGLLILGGGHVPTQNSFFEDIGLRGLLEGYSGVIFGISAGSMNSADIVYAQPEMDGESVDPDYKRFLRGLGLTKQMLLPHYNTVKDDVLDGQRVMEDITYPDSFGRRFIAIPDGSYLHSVGGKETIYGEAYILSEGVLTQVCADGEQYPLS